MRIELHTDIATRAPLAAPWNNSRRGVRFRMGMDAAWCATHRIDH